jgi:hypothetical protein
MIVRLIVYPAYNKFVFCIWSVVHSDKFSLFYHNNIFQQGADLTKTTSAVLASQANPDELGTTNDLTSLVTALPSQGVLRPGEKRVIHFCFSPRFTRSSKGWKMLDQAPPRRDFALFMHIETVGTIGRAVETNSGKNRGGGKLTGNAFMFPVHL